MASYVQMRERVKTIDWSLTATTGFWLESMWLSTLLLVALLFSINNSLVTFEEAKTYALHFFALVTLVLLIVDAVNVYLRARERGEDIESVDVVAWLRSDRANMLIASIAVFIFIYVVSTALSQLPSYSLMGVTPASTGYNLYTFLSMMVIFFSVVIHLRKAAQLWRIIYVIAFVGIVSSIYGTAQQFGWDYIGIVDSSARVISTFGNPIYFGAYLVMSIVATLAIMLERRTADSRLWTGLLTAGLALQLASMWFTGSRGPLVGLVAGLAVTFAALLLLSDRSTFVRAIVVTSIAGVLGVVVVLLPGGAGSTRAVQFGGELSGLTNQNGAGRIEAGLEGRGEIWGDVLELSVTWETFQPDEGIARILRPLFGFGPDMLRYSTSLISRPRSSLEIVDHAHNRVLQVLAEQGWLGLVAFLATLGISAWLLILTGLALYRDRSSRSTSLTIIFIAITGALAGVAVEQLTGVGRIADLLTSWVLIALLVIVYRHVLGVRQIETTATDAGSQKSESGTQAAPLRQSGETVAAIPFFVGVVILVIVLIAFVLVDGQGLRASRQAFGRTEAVDANEVFNRFIDARSKAPQIEHFTAFPAELLYDDSRDLLELGEKEEAARLAEEGFRLLLEYHHRNPLAIRTRILLAETAALLVEIGVADFKDEMVLRYEELARQFPNEAVVLSVVANAYASGGRYGQAIAMADRAISLEDITEPLPQAWWVKGISFERLNRIDEAIASLETAIERAPESAFAGLSHEELVKIYTEMGDLEKADFHSAAADAVYEAQASGE